MGARLSVHGLRHTLGGRQVLALEELDVAAGARVCLLGPNGAGKSTLLRLLAGVDVPRHGTVSVDGVRTSDGGLRLRRRVAYAAQRPVLLSTSVRRNVELPLRWRKVPRRRRRELATAALERLRIGDLAGRHAAALSGGERQRVSLARALALDPDVLLLDEPAAGLDAESRAAFLDDLDRALADRATTVLHVSHRVEEAMRLADEVVALIDGRIHQVGPATELTRRPISAGVARLVGYDNIVGGHAAPDGTVTVSGTRIGLHRQGPAGPVTIAVFANGVRQAHDGIALRVRRVSPGPGFWTVTLTGDVDLVMTVPLGETVPAADTDVRVHFEPQLAAVLPAADSTAPASTEPASLDSTPPVQHQPLSL